MGAHFPAVELDNTIRFSILSTMTGFLWHSSKWAWPFVRFLQLRHGSLTAEYCILLAISQRKHLISLTHLTSIIFDLTSFNRATYLKLIHFFPMLTPHTHWKQLKTRSSHVCKRYKVKLVGKKIINVFKFKFLELKPLHIYHQPLRKHYGLLMLSGGQERSWWYAIA